MLSPDEYVAMAEHELEQSAAALDTNPRAGTTSSVTMLASVAAARAARANAFATLALVAVQRKKW